MSAVPVIETCRCEVFRLTHVPDQLPSPSETMESGASPLEKLLTTEPLVTGVPQSSMTRVCKAVGNDAGTLKLAPSDVIKGRRRVGVQPIAGVAAIPLLDPGIVPAGAMSIRTSTV